MLPLQLIFLRSELLVVASICDLYFNLLFIPTPDVELLPAAPFNNVLPLLSIIVMLLVESLQKNIQHRKEEKKGYTVILMNRSL